MKVSTRQCRRIALMIAHEKIGQSKIIAHEQPVTLIPISTIGPITKTEMIQPRFTTQKIYSGLGDFNLFVTYIATIQPMLTWQLQNFVPV